MRKECDIKEGMALCATKLREIAAALDRGEVRAITCVYVMADGQHSSGIGFHAHPDDNLKLLAQAADMTVGEAAGDDRLMVKELNDLLMASLGLMTQSTVEYSDLPDVGDKTRH